MKKFLNNELINKTQEVSVEVLKEIFPKFAQASEDVQKQSNKWVLLHSGLTPDGLEWQVAYQDIPSFSNTMYLVFIFGADGELITFLPIQSNQSIPPLPEKKFGFDYYDFIGIQQELNVWLTDKKYQPITVDEEPKGRVVYHVEGSAEEIVEKLKKNESYGIYSVPAEVYLQKIAEFKRQKEEEEKKLILTPEEAAKESFKGLIIP